MTFLLFPNSCSGALSERSWLGVSWNPEYCTHSLYSGLVDVSVRCLIRGHIKGIVCSDLTNEAYLKVRVQS